MKGTLLVHNGCQDAVATALETHDCFETVCRELGEWTCDDADRIRSWGPDRKVDVEACFPELLRWVRDLWTPDRDAPGAGPRPHAPPGRLGGPGGRRGLPRACHIRGLARGGDPGPGFLDRPHQSPAVPAGTPVVVLGTEHRGLRCRVGCSSPGCHDQTACEGAVQCYSTHSFRWFSRDPVNPSV